MYNVNYLAIDVLPVIYLYYLLFTCITCYLPIRRFIIKYEHRNEFITYL